MYQSTVYLFVLLCVSSISAESSPVSIVSQNVPNLYAMMNAYFQTLERQMEFFTGKVYKFERMLDHLVSKAADSQESIAARTVEKFARENNLTKDSDIMLQACTDGDVRVVRACLDMGQSTDVTIGKYSHTCLHYAAQRNNVTLAMLLLERGANINAMKSYSPTPLMVAAGNGKLEVAELLVERGADKTLRDSSNMTALGYAIFKNEHSLITYLEKENAPK